MSKKKYGDTIFPIQSLWERSRTTNSEIENRIRLNFEPVRVFATVIVPCKSEKRSDQKWQRKPGDTIFPSLSLRELLVAMVTQSSAKHTTNPDADFPLPNDATHEIWSRLATALEKYLFENLDDDADWRWRRPRTTDLTISYYKLTFEPSTQVS